jgi:hypothetical protein
MQYQPTPAMMVLYQLWCASFTDSPTECIITLCITSERITSERIITERITSERITSERINLNV